MELRGAWATESMVYLADDNMSQFKINYRTDALKTDVNMFQNIKSIFSLGKCKEACLYFSELKLSRNVRRYNFQTTYNYSKIKPAEL